MGLLLILVESIEDLVFHDSLDGFYEHLVLFRGVVVQFAQVIEVEVFGVKGIIEIITNAAPTFINRQFLQLLLVLPVIFEGRNICVLWIDFCGALTHISKALIDVLAMLPDVFLVEVAPRVKVNTSPIGLQNILVDPLILIGVILLNDLPKHFGNFLVYDRSLLVDTVFRFDVVNHV